VTRAVAVDLFAGAGGFSTGARQAGVNIAWAANHNPIAVRVHTANHPDTAHACQDLQQANWAHVPAHDILLASPCCQGHSRARGKDTPQHDKSRSTAWAVVAAAEFHRPAALVVENVVDFTGWALYPAWCLALQTLGYKLTLTIADAADFGVAQNRVRMFLVGARKRAIDLQVPQRKHRAAADFLDFNTGNWSPVRKPGRAPATIARWESGRAAFGRRFVMPYYGRGSGLTGRSLDRPIGTIPTRDRWALVDGDHMRMLTVDEYRQAMGFPDGYQVPTTPRSVGIHLLGNAVCPPVAREFVGQVAAAI
jgi:DNA (cytosine-5)-methyltransferase 1